MTDTEAARRRAARRHWIQVLPTLAREDHWPADGAPDRPDSAAGPVRRVLDDEVAERVRAVTRDDGILLHAIVVAAVAVCHAARQDHATVVLATPPTAEPGGTGTVTVLPVPVRVTPDGTRRQQLLTVRQALLDAYAAQDVEPDWLSEHAPELCVTDGDSPLAGWLVRNPAIHAPAPVTVRFECVVEVRSRGGTIELTVQAGQNSRCQTGLDYLADQITDVIAQILAEPDAPVRTLRRTRPAIRDAAARAAAGPLCPEPVAVTDRIRKAAAEAFGPAVVAADATISYPELIARSDTIARGLLAESRGEMVALLTGQTAATVVSAVAALRAGVPYVIVPPDAAGDGRALRDRGVSLCVVPETSGQAPAERVAGGPLVRTIEQLAARGARPDAPEPPEELDPETTAYVLFTSGTTGAAKAVQVTRGSLAASTEARRTVYGSDRTSFMLLPPLHFDSSIAGLYGTLTCGGTLHVVPAQDLAEPAALAAYARDHDVEATLGLPRVLIGMLRTARELPGLRLVIGAGEAFPADLAPLAREVAPRARIVNEYGPSEATVWATWHDVAVGDTEVPIGRPVPGGSVYVLDAWGEPLPPGLVGQLAIGGPQVAAGYLGDDDLTRARFVPDPFGEPGGRLYLTGDEGWADDDGVLRYTGRADDEVKVRGARVTLADVAAVFRAQTGVADAEALLDQDRLVVFLTPVAGQVIDTGRVLDAARSGLAAHAVPGHIVAIPEIPRTATGKADRARLLGAARREPSGPRREPADAVEEQVLALFRITLGQDGLGMEADFFASGGDSIKAALLIAQLSRQLSAYMYVVALLDHPTPAALAAYLKREYADALADAGPGDDPGAESGATDEAAAELRRLVAAYARPRSRAGTPSPDRLPRAVFVLAPPRSGTTLLRVMLGGHPGLFSPPELELLQFGTLAQRRDALSGRHAFYQEGLVRAAMAVSDWDAEEASVFLDQMATDGWTVRDTYGWLQEQAGDRILVDKTTAYALDPAALARAEELFDRPLYIHLARHPRACVASFLEARLDQVYLRGPHPFAPGDAAELVWRVSHEHIAGFLDGIEPERIHRVLFEDLVTDPEAAARAIGEFIGVGFDEEMLDVHGDQRTRMSDGVRPGGRMLGDIKFHEHRGINAETARRWRDRPGPALHSRTLETARELGYLPDGPRTAGPLPSSPRWDWLLELMRPGTGMLNVPLALTGQGQLDLAATERAVRMLARRHHAFRSVVVAPQGEPEWRFLPDLTPSFGVESVPAEEQEDRADQLAQVPFGLEHDSPLRVHVLLDGDRFTLLFVVHHIAADAWSLRLMVRDFLTAYGDCHEGRDSSLPPLRRQPWDTGGDELDDAAAAEVARRVRRRLEGVQWSLSLPPPQDAEDAPPDVARVTLDAGTTDAIRRYAAARGSSLYRTLLGAFAWTLHTWTGDRDFCVGTPALNRGPLDDQSIGLFVTTAVVRVDLTGDITFDTLVRRNERAVRDAIADARLPFDEVVLALADQIGAGDSLLQVLFSVQELDLRLELRPELGLRRLPMRPRQAKFDIGFIVADEDGELVVNAELSRARFGRGDAGRLVADFTATTRLLVAAPDRILRAVPATRPGEST